VHDTGRQEKERTAQDERGICSGKEGYTERPKERNGMPEGERVRGTHCDPENGTFKLHTLKKNLN